MDRRHTCVIVLALALVLASAPSRAARDETITIGWASWASNEITARIARRVLEERLGVSVELKNVDVAPMYRGVAAGFLDVMLAGWLPTAHAQYADEVGDRMVNLGILYEHARMGWVVPAYIPESRLASMADLADPDVRERLGGRIVGIEPGAGMTRISRRAIDVYGLEGYRLEIASSAGMVAALAEAIERREWIVVNGWNPHWMWGRWKLRYLQDPEGLFGRIERVHVLARPRFYRDHVEAAAVLGRMWIPLAELQHALERARQTTFEQAAAGYVADHAGRVDYWVTGRLPGD